MNIIQEFFKAAGFAGVGGKATALASPNKSKFFSTAANAPKEPRVSAEMADMSRKFTVVAMAARGAGNDADIVEGLRHYTRNKTVLSAAENARLTQYDNRYKHKGGLKGFTSQETAAYALLLTKAVPDLPGQPALAQIDLVTGKPAATKKPVPKHKQQRKVTAIQATRLKPRATVVAKKATPKRPLAAGRLEQIQAERAGHPLDKVAANIRRDPWAAHSEKNKVVHPFAAAAERLKAKCFKVHPLDAVAAAMRRK